MITDQIQYTVGAPVFKKVTVIWIYLNLNLLSGDEHPINRRHFNREFIDGALMEFIWSRRYADTLWNRLLHAMQHVIYDADAENAENVDPNNIV